MGVGLAIGAGLSVASGIGQWWSDRGDRKRAQRAEGLLAGKFRDSSWADTRKQGLLSKSDRASNVAGSTLEDDLSRAQAAGVNPTLLNEKRKAFMLAEGQKRAALGGNLEAAGVQATGIRRAELQNKIDATPSGWESFIGGASSTAGTIANVAGAAQGLDKFGSMPDKSFAPGEIDDLLGTGSRRGSAVEGD